MTTTKIDRFHGFRGPHKYVHTRSQPENPFFPLIHQQQIAIIPEFTLESGVTLTDVPVAYKTWGELNEAGDNVMVICHALSGSADVSDWWGPLIGPNKAFDTTRFFIICCNALGSPYGSASPVTRDPTCGQYYGPEFPLTTIRDDVNIHRLVLDDLGVTQVAACIGGSMGGMLVLEWAYFGEEYVRNIVPIATSARHSAWCISWAEAQRQSISCDPKYEDGYYTFEDPPVAGLGAARMSALLTYRSRNSFESRFGRNIPDPSRHPYISTPSRRLPVNPREEHWNIHTDGFKSCKKLNSPPPSSPSSECIPEPASSATLHKEEKEITPTLPPGLPPTPPGSSAGSDAGSTATVRSPATNQPNATNHPTTANGNIAIITQPRTKTPSPQKPTTHFSAQNYLRYQADKFVTRFDANCYISITRKLDTHDVSRGRAADIPSALSQLSQHALVIGIESDGLFTYAEQQELAQWIPNAKLATIDSPEGHDAFLLQFKEVNGLILEFLEERLPEIMKAPGREVVEKRFGEVAGEKRIGVGEVDDITAW
ncbi:homoserine O-acetyltransferase [Ascodesmis nigricans]|uniref:Homoserine O-acetyltransferase n=1 Tax=Ascodesmis nigricans TaxID=341454 RepID=A0A4S2N609_9PEZI|nr:homoserine O-acetyltransferase [Ascodesmis nigricans]